MRAAPWSEGGEPVLVEVEVEVEVVPPTYRPVKVVKAGVGIFIGAYVRVVALERGWIFPRVNGGVRAPSGP
jgi:hypothetical protein